MTAIATATEVFDFMGTGTEERTANTTAVTSIISRVTDMIERYIGRKLSNTTFDIKIHQGRYCEIQGNLLFLKDIYFDTHTISELKEDDTVLVENTDFVMESPNILERIDACWSRADQHNIEITGATGLVYDSTPEETATYLAIPTMKQIAIEETAAMSGLWNTIIDDGEGNQGVINKTNLSSHTQKILNRYILPIV